MKNLDQKSMKELPTGFLIKSPRLASGIASVLDIMALLFLLMLTACSVTGETDRGKPRFTREIDWMGKGVWLKADTHTHTKFSDGSHTVAEVVDAAAREGVEVLAITDHCDYNLNAATPEYFAAIDEARAAHPDMIIFAGLEWNIPPTGGDDHVTIIVMPDKEKVLAEFKARFDDYKREEHDPAVAASGLKWLAEKGTSKGIAPVLVYEHPSRKNLNSTVNADNLRAWRKVNDLIIGFSGAPGHQGKEPFGSYKYTEKTIDRWDPGVARVGDAWDSMLREGYDVWGAHAPSDFHNANPKNLNDFWPGRFSETWIYAPERSAEGVLRAFRAGSFFGAHGHIVREAEISVNASGLKRPAGAGEAISAAAGTELTVTLRMKIPEQVWDGTANRIDVVELIGIDASGSRVLTSAAPQSGSEALVFTLPTPDGGIVIRARGYGASVSGERFAFYTNHVRVGVLR